MMSIEMTKFWTKMRAQAAAYLAPWKQYEPVKAPENTVLIFRTPLEEKLLGSNAAAAKQPPHANDALHRTFQ